MGAFLSKCKYFENYSGNLFDCAFQPVYLLLLHNNANLQIEFLLGLIRETNVLGLILELWISWQVCDLNYLFILGCMKIT